MAIQNEQRFCGIDELKVTAMFLIVIGHLIVQYGIGANLNSLNLTTYTIKLLSTVSAGAVNCYALCTGFLMINKKARPARLIDLWFQVIFYSVLITSLFSFLLHFNLIPAKITISSEQWLTSLTPITRNSWWYASCYFGLFLLIPVLNYIINRVEKRHIQQFILFALIVASFSSFVYGDGLCLKFGYSVTWLIILYVLGAYIRLYGVRGKNHLVKWGGVVLFTWLLAYVLDITVFVRVTGAPKASNILCLYTSPLTILASFELFLFFVSLRQSRNNKKAHFVKVLSVATFGVYLIHTHDVIWDYFRNFFVFENKNGIELLILTLVIAIIVFFICFILDYLRQLLFKLTRMEKISNLLAEKLSVINEKMILIINKNNRL